PAECFGPVLVESAVAARPAIAPGAAPSFGCRLHPLHALLHSFHAELPTLSTAMCPACHSSTPYQVSENHKAERPPQDKADDHQADPRRLANIVQMRCDGHDSLM